MKSNNPYSHQIIIKFGLIMMLCCCQKTIDKIVVEAAAAGISPQALLVEKKIVSDTSNQSIYDFMKIVIEDQKLNLNYGISLEPEKSCDIMQGDSMFLRKLIIEHKMPNRDTIDIRNLAIIISTLPPCLTTLDVAEMLTQKEKLKEFVWDNNRLQFNISNKKNYYSFSPPLFSKDKKCVVMMIKSLCPGLCGTGWTVVFTDEGGKWLSKKGWAWYH